METIVGGYNRGRTITLSQEQKQKSISANVPIAATIIPVHLLRPAVFVAVAFAVGIVVLVFAVIAVAAVLSFVAVVASFVVIPEAAFAALGDRTPQIGLLPT